MMPPAFAGAPPRHHGERSSGGPRLVMQIGVIVIRALHSGSWWDWLRRRLLVVVGAFRPRGTSMTLQRTQGYRHSGRRSTRRSSSRYAPPAAVVRDHDGVRSCWSSIQSEHRRCPWSSSSQHVARGQRVLLRRRRPTAHAVALVQVSSGLARRSATDQRQREVQVMVEPGVQFLQAAGDLLVPRITACAEDPIRRWSRPAAAFGAGAWVLAAASRRCSCFGFIPGSLKSRRSAEVAPEQVDQAASAVSSSTSPGEPRGVDRARVVDAQVPARGLRLCRRPAEQRLRRGTNPMIADRERRALRGIAI